MKRKTSVEEEQLLHSRLRRNEEEIFSKRDVYVSLADASTGGDESAAAVVGVRRLRVDGGAGVDMGLVGRAVGLDPLTVLLNGHYLSRTGTGFVSSCVTWDSLACYFAARGLPAGRSEFDSIRVHGKSNIEGNQGLLNSLNVSQIALKRKVLPEAEGLHRKKKTLLCGSNVPESNGVQLSDDVCLSMKRKLRLDDGNALKKRRHILDRPGSSDDAGEIASSPQVFLNSGCAHIIDKCGKRLRTDDLVPSLPCKRIK